ncbi:isoleucine--tRNA ligase [Patescibacteria group bacterium]|nr:MAG: isoleucine--tRNA ligase [Patescibacteria group bacterium]
MPAPNFPELEEQILRFWEEKKIFGKTLEKKSPRGNFVFFEGPPTANGRPGIHHVEARAFKDLFPRYKTMAGWRVERKAGWDTHGLPVELGVEKALGISGKKQIESLKATPAESIAFFNAECKKSVWSYLEDWNKITRRIGFWLDLEHPYITYETPYIESLWWIIKQVWDQGLLYKDYKIVPYCPRCGTALSSHEVALGYKEVTEPSVIVKLRAAAGQKIKSGSGKEIVTDDQTFFLVWTTTPWTLPANVALAVGPNITYRLAKNGEETLIVAEALAEKVLPPDSKTLFSVMGRELAGLSYEPLFTFVKPDRPAYRLIAGSFVSVEEGTGIVHIAPAFGEDDLNVGRGNNLPVLMTVDPDGRFLPEITPWAGEFVKDADPAIIASLKKNGALYASYDYTHDYPFCWRCGTPLLYYAKESWWIRMTALQEKLLRANAQINWVPEYIKEGRFGEWLRSVKDWAFSRERYWGTPLPIWECEKCEHRLCVGSLEELEKLTGELPKNSGAVDLHRPFVDALKIHCQKCGAWMSRVKEVADVWFDSGAMPFAEWHYPFENKKRVDGGEAFPADYISEAIDQTRGWFYTLLAVAALLGKDAPYKNVISLGHLLDAKGQKMSKSKGNVVDPWQMIEKYGADCLRLYMYSVNQPGDAKRFDEKDLAELQRKFFLILWNVLAFYKTYSSIHYPLSTIPSRHILDRWILARLSELAEKVTADLEAYRVTEPARALADFVTDLSTWYVRRSRERFKGAGGKQASATLHFALLQFSKLLAPFAPFTAEALYRELQGSMESVHLENWPKLEKKMSDKKLLEEMARARVVVSLGLEQRSAAKMPTRQPLAKAVLTGAPFTDEIAEIIRDELNVLAVEQKKSGEISVTLDTALTPELKRAGALRELIRHIQALRKSAGLTVSDFIHLSYETSGEPAAEFKKVETELGQAVRAKTVTTGRADLPYTTEVQIQGETAWIGLEKV